MLLVTFYTEGFIEIWKFKIIGDCDINLHRQEEVLNAACRSRHFLIETRGGM